MRRPFVALSIIVVLMVVFSGIGVVASGGYGLSVPDAIDTDTRTVTVDGESFEVSALAVVEPGESISVDVTAPEDEDVRVELRDSDGNVETFARATGSERVSVGTDGAEPGFYVLALYADGHFEELHPVVVEGYDVEMTHPSEITEKDTITFDLTATQTESDESLERVEIGLLKDGSEDRYVAEEVDDETYQLTLSSEELSLGEYDVYGVALGPNEVRGTQEPLGVSQQTTLSVTEADDSGSETPTPTPTPSNQTATPTQTPVEPNGTATPTGTPTQTATPTSTPTPTDPTATPDTSVTPTPTTTTDDSVITPATAATETPTSSTDRLSTGGWILLTLGLGGGILLGRRFIN